MEAFQQCLHMRRTLTIDHHPRSWWEEPSDMEYALKLSFSLSKPIDSMMRSARPSCVITMDLPGALVSLTPKNPATSSSSSKSTLTLSNSSPRSIMCWSSVDHISKSSTYITDTTLSPTNRQGSSLLCFIPQTSSFSTRNLQNCLGLFLSPYIHLFNSRTFAFPCVLFRTKPFGTWTYTVSSSGKCACKNHTSHLLVLTPNQGGIPWLASIEWLSTWQQENMFQTNILPQFYDLPWHSNGRWIYWLIHQDTVCILYNQVEDRTLIPISRSTTSQTFIFPRVSTSSQAAAQYSSAKGPFMVWL